MKNKSFLLIVLSLTLSTITSKVNSQIVPDNTLGQESSIVTPLNSNSDRIDGGASRGTNLFHSFSEFSIPQGRGAYFANPEAIRTIFSRVTGNNPSQIFGTLGVLGNANLFLINPNGIIFGPNAKLDISGSFVGSTANSIIFPNSDRFSATNPEGVPLLTVNVPVPIGLQFEGDATGSIINGGNLATGGNIGLIGGTVVNTGQLATPSGQITLATATNGVQTQIELDATGGFLGQTVQPLTESNSTSILSLSELVGNGGQQTGLKVDSQGQVRVTSSDTPVETGDIVIVGASDKVSLQGKTANLLSGNNLSLINSLVGTEGNLNLLANETVKITDSLENPLVIVSGENLLIQGNEGIDIFALNHPNSGIVSGGDMILRSPNAVVGDGKFWSGGSFRIEKLDGSLGDLWSPNDPIIQTQGDVEFFGYQGASLHIIAGGSVNINTVIITGADTTENTINPTSTPELANITLSDGKSLVIDGSQRPTLDIRAGVDPSVISNQFITGEIRLSSNFNFSSVFNLVIQPFNFADNPTSADITIGNVFIVPPDGMVYLTNQFKPNLSLSGGDIIINGGGLFSRAGQRGDGIDARGFNGNGSDVIVDSRQNINLNGSFIDTSSNLGNGGNINFISQESILLNQGLLNSSITGSGKGRAGDINLTANESIKVTSNSIIFSGVDTDAEGSSGKITLNTNNLEIDDSFIVASTLGKGDAGIIEINTNSIKLNNEAGIIVFNDSFEGNGGQLNIQANDSIVLDGESQILGGEIRIETHSLLTTNGGVISNLTSEKKESQNITIHAKGDIILEGIATSEGSLGGIASFATEGDSGNINITAANLDIKNGASVSTSTLGEGKAGNINIIADESIKLRGQSSNGGISVINAFSGGQGDAGDITIVTGRLHLQDGSDISTRTIEGNASAGNLTITASESVQVEGVTPIATVNGILPTTLSTQTQGQGNAGNLTINTGQLLVKDGGQIRSDSSAEEGGNAGNLTIIASDWVQVIGTSPNGEPASFIASATEGKGNAGNLTINTGQLLVQDGGQIRSDSSAEEGGNAGNLTIIASDWVRVTGTSSNPQLASLIVSATGGKGNAGNITIETGQLIIQDGAVLESGTAGAGQGGNTTITATESVNVASGGQISAFTFREGNAGNLTIIAGERVQVEGVSPITQRPSLITTQTERQGQGGNLNIQTGQLLIKDRGQISSGSVGQGQGGDLTIVANQWVQVEGEITRGTSNSALATQTRGQGDAGDLTINTRQLLIKDGGFISASTRAEGNGGEVTINASESITVLNNGDIDSSAAIGATGDGRNINLTTSSLTLSENARINVRSVGQEEADAGSINIQANTINLQNNSQITASTSGGQGGTITLNANTVEAANGSQILTTTSGNNQAGDINLQVTDKINITGTNTGILANTDINARGNGGTINIETPTLTLSDKAQITASTSGTADAGNIIITQAQTISLSESTLSTAVNTGAIGQGGKIDLTTETLSLDNQANITASTAGTGNSGDITIQATENLSLNNQSQIQTLVESTAQGNSQQINLNTPNLTLNNQSQISAATRGKGNAGSLTIEEANTVTLDNNSSISTAVEAGASANEASNITLDTQNLSVTNNSEITASTSADGDAGNIIIPLSQTISLSESTLSTAVNTGAIGQGGKIDLTTETLSLDNQANITASTAGTGNSGDITIQATENLSLNNQSQIQTLVESTAQGNSQQINLNTPNLTLNNQSQISAATRGKGNAGSLTIEEANTVTLDNNSSISTAVEAGASANEASNITLDTQNLSVTNNSEITASTSADGDAGNITITANNTVFLDNNSTIASNAEPNATGDGGDINLETSTLTINRSQISTSSEGQPAADAGTINLNANQITLQNQAQISATTSAGQGGNITLSAQTLEADNGSQILTTTTGNNNAGDITLKIVDNIFLTGENTGIFADTGINAQGNGGNIFIDPLSFIIADGATISVNNRGSGTGGNIEIFANNLNLNQGTISAQTTSNTGGNITLNINDTLTLRNNSQISATAGIGQGGGNGGNININARLILTYPYENSDITANAFTGQGGNINITAEGIFGLDVQQTLTVWSDITASSEFGLAGNIVLNTSGINPIRGVENLSQQTVTPEVIQACQATGEIETAQFYNVGQGGIPYSPDEMLTNEIDINWTPWVNSSTENLNLENFDYSSSQRIEKKQLSLPCQQ